MTSLAIPPVLYAAIFAATAANGSTAAQPTAEDYAAARAKTAKTGEPILILVGAEWCPACVEMKKEVMPEIRKKGILRKVAFANVNLDNEQELAKELTEGGPIPQMIMYRKTPLGWLRRVLVGGQNPRTVEKFIQRGLELDEATKKAEAKKQEQDSSGDKQT